MLPYKTQALTMLLRTRRSVVQGDGSVAVIIRFYAAEKAKDDLVKHLRTLIFETERRGYHAYILYEVRILE